MARLHPLETESVIGCLGTPYMGITSLADTIYCVPLGLHRQCYVGKAWAVAERVFISFSYINEQI